MKFGSTVSFSHNSKQDQSFWGKKKSPKGMKENNTLLLSSREDWQLQFIMLTRSWPDNERDNCRVKIWMFYQIIAQQAIVCLNIVPPIFPFCSINWQQGVVSEDRYKPIVIHSFQVVVVKSMVHSISINSQATQNWYHKY